MKEEGKRVCQPNDEGEAADEENLTEEGGEGKGGRWAKVHDGGGCGNDGARTFPMARRPESKKRSMPRKRKSTPKPVSPMPISVVGGRGGSVTG